MHGALRAGARVSGASPAYGVDEMAYALRTAKARVLICGRASLEVAVEAARKAGLEGEGRVVVLEGEAEGFETVSKGLFPLSLLVVLLFFSPLLLLSVLFFLSFFSMYEKKLLLMKRLVSR